MRIRSKFIIAGLCFLFACTQEINEKHNVVKSETKTDSTSIFINYLKNKHHVDICNNSHCYIVIPETGCNLCINSTVEHLLKDFQAIDTSKITFIVSNGIWLKDSLFNSKAKYYKDKAETIDQLDLHIINVTIIYTNNMKIDSIKSVSSQEAKDIIKFCSH